MRYAKKSLGQNFLIDSNIIKKIVNLTSIEGKNILEIGAGYTTPFLLEALINNERVYDDGNLQPSYFKDYIYDPKLIVSVLAAKTSVSEVKPGSSNDIFFARVTFSIELCVGDNLVSSVDSKSTAAAFEELSEKYLSEAIEVKADCVKVVCEFRNPMPEIAFVAFCCFCVSRIFFGSISDATIDVTSSEMLNPEPPLLTKLK